MKFSKTYDFSIKPIKKQLSLANYLLSLFISDNDNEINECSVFSSKNVDPNRCLFGHTKGSKVVNKIISNET